MAEKMHLGLQNLLKGSKSLASETCLRLRVQLTKQEYYSPNGAYGFAGVGKQVIGLSFDNLYSVSHSVADCKIKRHGPIIFHNVGFTIETVKRPKWWTDRNATEAPKDTCRSILAPLSGDQYFMPNEDEGGVCFPAVLGEQPIGLALDGLYSEISGLTETAVLKHGAIVFHNCGFIVETVSKPAWWAKRDEGGI